MTGTQANYVFTSECYYFIHLKEYLLLAVAIFVSFVFVVWLANLLLRANQRLSSISRREKKQLLLHHPNTAALLSTSATTNGSLPHKDEKGNDQPASMMEQLVPEIMQHTLSYLDYRSLCNMSMTCSVLRRVANDDSVWKAVFHKDFTAEQDAVVPPNEWKAHYSVTKAVADVNMSFYKKFKAKSLRGMSSIWLQADYVKCIHPGGELLSGYDMVMENWKVVFNWIQHFDFSLDEVRVRVRGDVAWVTVKEFVNASVPLLSTNCFELHNGEWFMVHRHSSPQMEAGGVDFGQIG
ncbi:unnamed protein product [Sphagnum balticum]